ncbi:tyrosine--tRNA ligase [bacterium]|nr:tyrosine--tRNA ligase [bacterium]
MEKKLELILRNTEEVLTEKDLKALLQSGTKLRHYIGFEISGKVHLGGLLLMGKIADFLEAGMDCTVFLADWHSFINDKLGGDWQVIKKVALGYFKEALIAALKCFSVSPERVHFVLGSELYEGPVQWENLMEVSKHTTLARVKRSVDIAGRQAREGIDFAKLIYPPLQVADIFTLGVNVAHAGMDQRKAHVIARRVALNLKLHPLKDNKGKKIKPVAIHTPLLQGLQKPAVWPLDKLDVETKTALKMSKSNPRSAIWVHDSPEVIKEKISRAFCPPDNIEFNPIINWVKHLVFWGSNEGEFLVKRAKKFGGNKTYYRFDELVNDYQEGALHPQDLKNALAEWLIAKLAPARKHFQKPKIKEALQFLEKYA